MNTGPDSVVVEPRVVQPPFPTPAGATATLIYGVDVIEALESLPEGSAHMVATSPPYWGLRDYDAEGQIGLEPTPESYIQRLVEVFRAVKRVLRKDGTVWLNLGDSYVSKRLVGIPWRVALALQADGWFLRNDIIWHKPSCLPESVRDRCTVSHEYVFLLAHPDGGGRYFYDADAIREPHKADSVARVNRGHHREGHKWEDGPGDQTIANDLTRALHEEGRNKRSVWSVNPKPYKGAHFATWPEKLVEPMILAGSPEGGVVLDIFSGSATTGLVATRAGRRYIGIDLNRGYLDLAVARVEGREAPSSEPVEEQEGSVTDLFGL